MTEHLNSADIIILGAGVVGTSIAFHLAKRKAGRIILLDKGDVASGGSGRSSALVRMHYSFSLEVQLAVKSLEIFRNWQDIVERPGDFRKTGFIRIVPEQEIDRLKANVAMQRDLGVNAFVVTRDDLKVIEPGWNFDDVPAAAFEPDSGYGDGAGVATDFLSRAKEMGVHYAPRTEASLLIREGHVHGVETTNGNIEAPIVVAAIGPWSTAFFRKAGIEVPIETEYHQVAILRNPPQMKPWSCACIDSDLNLYYRSESGNLTLVGGFYGPRGADPDDFPQSASEDTLLEMAIRLSKRIPALEDAGLFRSITGLYDMTPDSRPLLGQIPDIDGLYIAAGFCGMGFKISPAVGLAMSEFIMDGKSSFVNLHPFRPTRFEEGQPIRATFEYQDD